MASGSLLSVVMTSTLVISVRGGSTARGKKCLAVVTFIQVSGGTEKAQARAAISLQTVDITKVRCGTVNLMDSGSLRVKALNTLAILKRANLMALASLMI